MSGSTAFATNNSNTLSNLRHSFAYDQHNVGENRAQSMLTTNSEKQKFNLLNMEANMNKRVMNPGKSGYDFSRNREVGSPMMKGALDNLIDKNHMTTHVDTPYKRWLRRNQLKKIDKSRLQSDQMASLLVQLDSDVANKSMLSTIGEKKLSTHSSMAVLRIEPSQNQLVKYEVPDTQVALIEEKQPFQSAQTGLEVALRDKNMNLSL